MSRLTQKPPMASRIAWMLRRAVRTEAVGTRSSILAEQSRGSVGETQNSLGREG